jgi:raffinose/stachyose/melibiose transport system permease protein
MTRLGYGPRTFARELLMILLAALWIFPFYLLINISVRHTGGDVYASPLTPSSHPTLEPYLQAWQGGTLGHGFVNSAIITVSSVALLIVIGSVTAYALARRPGTPSAWLTGLFTAGLILPVQLGVIPLFAAMRSLGLVGTYAGMILLYAGFLMPLSVFLYSGFLKSMPPEYEEAAEVDGGSRMRIFARVVFPMLRPATGTVAILSGLIIWNDFFTPLIFLSGTSHATLPVIVYDLVGGLGTEWNVIFAAVVISIAPLVLFFAVAQRRLIRGFSGGIKA